VIVVSGTARISPIEPTSAATISVATIHNLVLAYAGTALPLLLVLHATRTNTTDSLNFQDTAEPIVAAVIGCAALIAAVPLTTGLAALLISRVPAHLLPHSHGHAH